MNSYAPYNTSMLTFKVDISDELEKLGFAVLPSLFFSINDEIKEAMDHLVLSFDDLPLDPDDEFETRFRRYSQFIRTPSGHLEPIQPERDSSGNLVTYYYQPKYHNDQDGGKRRPFIPLNPAVRSNPGLHALIEFYYSQIFSISGWKNVPVLVGVHQVRSSPVPGVPFKTSPPWLHRDGERYTVVVLMYRDAVTGGKNLVGGIGAVKKTPDELRRDEILAEFTLEAFLDSFVVDDLKVSHHLEDIHAAFDDRSGNRSVFLIDFTKYMPRYDE